MTSIEHLTVIGAGSWGTALAYLFSRRVSRVSLLTRTDEAARTLQATRRNSRYLPSIELPDNIHCLAVIDPAVSGAGVVILAVPSFAIRETCENLRHCLHPEALLLNAAKGLDSETGRRLSEVVESAIPGIRPRLAVLSGPNLAREAALDLPTATVIAAYQEDVAARLQEALTLPGFRIYTNPDVIGVELGGALKNIIAIAAGIVDGIGYGENTKAALVSRGLSEMRRLGRALGARDATFSGLSGIGDLYATCASSQSRNHHVGYELGRGRSLNEILQEMDQTAEGVPTAKAASLLARRAGVSLPIIEGLNAVLFEGASARDGIEDLMRRAPACEVEE